MNIEEFIKAHIESVDELRALLLFHSQPEVARGVDETAGKLYMAPAGVATILETFAKKGFLAASGQPRRYVFRPESKELEALIHELARLDREKPVTLIKMVYSKPKDVDAFANAFKIRKEK